MLISVFLVMAGISVSQASQVSPVSPVSQVSVTSGAEQKALIDTLSGATELGSGKFPSRLSHRYTDSFEIQVTAQFLKDQYDALGIQAQVLEYDPIDAFPYYFQNTDETYRSYFQHLIPMLKSDFEGLCAGTLAPDQKEKVIQRLKRVGFENEAFCAAGGNYVERYITKTVAHTTEITKKMIQSRLETAWPNVVAVIPTAVSSGEVGQRPLCILGAHMDSVAREGGGRGPIVSPMTYAPGADDNASGTAAVLTLARAFNEWIKNKKPSLSCDLAFVHFSGEEEGLLGSLAFVHLQNSRPITWMINFDMIAYDATNDKTMNIGYDERFGKKMTSFFSSSNSTKLRTVVVERNTFIYSSDQISFWGIGVPAISVSEQACSSEQCSEPFKNFNPNLHTPEDTASKLDFDYAAMVIEHSYDAIRRMLTDKWY